MPAFELKLSTSELLKAIEEDFDLEYLFVVLAEDRGHINPSEFAKHCVKVLEDGIE